MSVGEELVGAVLTGKRLMWEGSPAVGFLDGSDSQRMHKVVVANSHWGCGDALWIFNITFPSSSGTKYSSVWNHVLVGLEGGIILQGCMADIVMRRSMT